MTLREWLVVVSFVAVLFGAMGFSLGYQLGQQTAWRFMRRHR